MEDEVDELLGLFAVKIADQYDFVEADPQRGVIVVREGATDHRLHFDPEALAGTLADHDPGFWGPGVDPVESVARFMTVHLDESLATRVPHASGRWTYRTGFFDPRPPWLRGPHAQD